MYDDSLLEPNLEAMNKLQNLFNLKKFGLLEQTTKELIKKHPKSAKLQNILGVSLQAQAKFHLSGEAYKKAIDLKPNLHLAHFNLGNIFKETLDLYSAEKSYKKCLEISPNYIDAYIGLGLIQLDIHKLDESISTFTKALKIQPSNAILHRHLSEITKFSKKNSHMEEMEKIISNANSTSDQQMHLSFALGKAYEDIGLYDKAFSYWEKGNSIKRKKINYSIKRQIDFVENVKNTFTKKLFKKFEGHTDKSDKIIFILGMPRSGTTLVQQILSSHPNVGGVGESNLFSNIIKQSFYEKNGALKKDLYKLDGKFFNKIGEDYTAKLKQYSLSFAASNEVKNILVKDPLNFRWVGYIKLIFPNAKIVHCTRNPLDNCISLFKTFFIGGVDFSYDLNELGEYYNLYLNLMNFWKKIIPDCYENISYEKIINNRENETKKLLNFCNLQWNENCMQSHKFVHAMSTGTNSINIHQPMYKTSIQYWRQYEKQLKPLMKIIQI